ncbi:MAG: hypothetical protein HYR96_05310 [Deltaproteobacteria bacterium]|nr:hypothetical protein [Deltaproteobacteria bacterium]MBI3294231.1 hypothetical protein [Deltaproteobacteria bacterium]
MIQNTQDRSVEMLSDALKGARVAVCVCGGIGAVEVVKIIRELRRHGAETTAFMTDQSKRFITELSVEWACDRKVVAELTSDAEHLAPFDLILVVPATLNTISKVALGLCDNAVTTLIGAQLVRLKGRVLFVPAMNGDLAEHPLLPAHRERLTAWGVHFLDSERVEGRVKVVEPQKIAEAMMERWRSA